MNFRKSLKRLLKLPFNLLGLEVVRTTNFDLLLSQAAKRTSAMPSWAERIESAKKLGFSPGVILDGGAFKGFWTKDIVKIFPGSQVFLVEPNPFVSEEIESNISSISPKPIVVNSALGDTEGSSKLNFWLDRKSDTGASLQNHVRGDAHLKIDVKVDTIDSIFHQHNAKPDMIKLDLQGGEKEALFGASESLRHAELVLIEFGCLEAYVDRTTPKDLFEIMFANDYGLYDIVDCHYRPYDGALTGGDFIFVKNSSVLRRYKGWE